MTMTDSIALRNAAILGDLPNVLKLLDAGADVDELDDYGYTPLHRCWAAPEDQKKEKTK